jgi:hypothetical protein
MHFLHLAGSTNSSPERVGSSNVVSVPWPGKSSSAPEPDRRRQRTFYTRPSPIWRGAAFVSACRMTTTAAALAGHYSTTLIPTMLSSAARATAGGLRAVPTHPASSVRSDRPSHRSRRISTPPRASPSTRPGSSRTKSGDDDDAPNLAARQHHRKVSGDGDGMSRDLNLRLASCACHRSV